MKCERCGNEHFRLVGDGYCKCIKCGSLYVWGEIDGVRKWILVTWRVYGTDENRKEQQK